MRQLTNRELADYERDGYVIVESIFPRKELADLDRHVDEIIAEQHRQHAEAPAAGDSISPNHAGWLFALGLVSPRTAAFCEDARILALCSSIVQPGIAIYSAKLVAKEPGDVTPCLWHQDDAYYTRHSDARTRMSVWIPLGDAVLKEQGGLKVIPGSHRRGLQPCSMKPYGACSLSIDVEVDESEAIHVPVRAGSILLFSALLWHSSVGNATTQRRRAFIVSYQEATARQGNGKQWKILRPAG